MNKLINRQTIKEAFNIEGLNYKSDTNMEKIEKYFLNKCKDLNLEISIDVTFDEPLNFKTLAYTHYANSILVYPLSQRASDAYIIDMLNSKNFKSYHFPSPVDKYELNKLDINFQFENLVILPGDNVLKSIINKKKLEKISEMNDVIVKLHPLTSYDLELEIKKIFKNSIIVGSEFSLYSLFYNAKNIFTSSVSETFFYAKLHNKNLFSIDEEDKKKGIMSNYTFITKNIESSLNPKKFINKLLNSKISCIFNSNDPYVFEKINNYINYIKIKKDFYEGSAF